MKNILILGGDGYLGWPTAMYFSAMGHNVTVVDNYFRRNICKELDVKMLYETPTLEERSKIWMKSTSNKINVIIGDLSDPDFMQSLFIQTSHNSIFEKNNNSPDTIIHYAEQPSAPYSLLNYKTADFTITNNLRVTNNLLFAIKDYCPEAHLIKLGTMGEYGTPEIDIEEGWLEITHKGRKDKFLFPRQAGSIYHTTKIMDTDLMWFAVRTWKLKITDLMQGPVYGIETSESLINKSLRTIFNYDEIFGTVLNRFIVQAVAGYPLTVYGQGGQTRGYLNIKDTLQCINAAHENPAKQGELRIFNQITETFTVNQLAKITQDVGNQIGLNVTIDTIKNPRVEKENHYYNPTYQGLRELGVEPHYLTHEIMHGIFEIVLEHKDSIKKNTIFKGIQW
jgi:UDP-sulfoquinovose synthase